MPRSALATLAANPDQAASYLYFGVPSPSRTFLLLLFFGRFHTRNPVPSGRPRLPAYSQPLSPRIVNLVRMSVNDGLPLSGSRSYSQVVVGTTLGYDVPGRVPPAVADGPHCEINTLDEVMPPLDGSLGLLIRPFGSGLQV